MPPSKAPEIVDHPPHYNDHPSGVECITVTEHYNFNVGNAIKYLWRAGLKGDALVDLEKARWYVEREIARLAVADAEAFAKAAPARAASKRAQERRAVPSAGKARGK